MGYDTKKREAQLTAEVSRLREALENAADDGHHAMCETMRLPPDAVLDVERSPKRDGNLRVTDGEFKTVDGKESLLRTIDKALASDGNRVRPCPADCAKATKAEWAEAVAKVNAHAALLSRALILIGGWNTRYHGLNTAQIDEAKKLGADIIAVLRPVGEKPGRG